MAASWHKKKTFLLFLLSFVAQIGAMDGIGNAAAVDAVFEKRVARDMARASAERDKQYAQLDRELYDIVTQRDMQYFAKLEQVQKLLDRGASPNGYTDVDGHTLFYYVCVGKLSTIPLLQEEQKAVVQMLYCWGADDLCVTSVRDLSDDMLELFAILERDSAQYKKALNKAFLEKPLAAWLPDSLAELIRQYSDQEHPLKVRSAKIGDPLLPVTDVMNMRKVLETLYVGGLVDIKDAHYGGTPLHYAVQQDRHTIIRLLLHAGLAIDAQDDSGRTSLHHAAERKQRAIVLMLLENKADIEIEAQDGRTPLMRAVYRADDLCGSIAQLLLESRASCTARNKYGWTALHYAADGACVAQVELLLRSKANINAKDNKGWTPLDVAESHDDFKDLAEMRRYQTVRQLLLAQKKEPSSGCIVA